MAENESNFAELDSMEAAEEKKRRAEIIKKSERRRNTILFFIAASVVQIVLMIAFMFALFIVALLLVYRVFDAQSPVFMQIASLAAFIGGIALGFISQKKIMRFIIDKMQLADKLQDGIADHYLTKREWIEKHGRR